MSKTNREQFFILKAEDIPEDVSIQAVKDMIGAALHTEKELKSPDDPRKEIQFNTLRPVSWRTMRKVFNIKQY